MSTYVVTRCDSPKCTRELEEKVSKGALAQSSISAPTLGDEWITMAQSKRRDRHFCSIECADDYFFAERTALEADPAKG